MAGQREISAGDFAEDDGDAFAELDEAKPGHRQ